MPEAQIVDLSHHNGTVDFARLKAAGVDAVIHKASQGTGYVDPMYASRRAAAKAAGMPWGAYHVVEPAQGARAQIDHFLDVVGRSPSPELRLALDVELPTTLPVPTVAARYDDAAEYLERRVGYVVLVYTYPWYADAGYCAGLGDELLWMADYDGHLDVPAAWGHDIKRCLIWQQGQRQVPGASAGDGPGVDYNTAPSLDALLAPHTEDSMPLSPDDLAKIAQVVKDNTVPRTMDDPTTAHGQVPVTEVLHAIARTTLGLPDAIGKVATQQGVKLPADFAQKVAAELAADAAAGAAGRVS